MTTDYKQCRSCNTDLPASSFPKDRASKDGLRTRCRACIKLYDDTLRGQRNERARLAYATNPAEKTAKTSAYHQARPEWSKERKSAHYQRNRKELLTAHRERLANDAEYRDRHRDYTRRAEQRRRAQKTRTNADTLPSSVYVEVLSEYDGCCWICGVEIIRPIVLHWDHVQPLSKGGAHDRSNLRPACSTCNVRKNAAWPFTDDMAESLAEQVRAERASEHREVMP